MIWHRIVPELYLHVEPISMLQKESLTFYKDKLYSICSDFLKIGEYKFSTSEVFVEEGTIKARVLIPIVIFLDFLTRYGGIRTGTDFLFKDIQTAYSTIVNQVRKTGFFEKEICIQRRLGVIGRIDYVLFQYKNGVIDDKECQYKLIELFDIINSSPDKHHLISALVQYVNNKYPTNFWDLIKKHTDDTFTLPKKEDVLFNKLKRSQ